MLCCTIGCTVVVFLIVTVNNSYLFQHQAWGAQAALVGVAMGQLDLALVFQEVEFEELELDMALQALVFEELELIHQALQFEELELVHQALQLEELELVHQALQFE